MKPHHHQQQQHPEPQSRTRIANKAPTVLAYDTKQAGTGRHIFLLELEASFHFDFLYTNYILCRNITHMELNSQN